MDISSLYSFFLRYPNVVIDSRQARPDALFFALRGDNFDGNQFAARALELGCNLAVVDDPLCATDSRYILVDNVLDTLQQLAHHHRMQRGIPIIGITGTNGKTTTKELIAQVLSEKYVTLSTNGNMNNHIGVPLTLLRLTAEHQIAVVEMGANYMGEIEELTKIVAPTFGIITNIGKAHLEGFGSIEGVLSTKKALYDYLRANQGCVFRNIGNTYLESVVGGLKEVTYGLNSELADVGGHLIGNTAFVTLAWNSHRFGTGAQIIHTHFVGAYNAENMLAAIAIGLYFDVPLKAICHAMETYQPQNHRSQYQKTDSNELIIDAYNANPSSMTAALENFKTMNYPVKTVILGDMRELGVQSEVEHHAIIQLLEKLKFDHVILVGENFTQCGSEFTTFADAQTLNHWLKDHPIRHQAILIKGSRGVGLERVIEQL